MMDISAQQLNTLARDVVVPGQIYRLRMTEQEGVKPKNEGDNGRNKYFVVLGTTADGELIGFVLVNSEINQRLPEIIKSLQYKITAKEYSFLKKDSYICCSELKHIESACFFARFQNDAVAILSDDHLEVVKNLLAQSPRVSAADMREFGLL